MGQSLLVRDSATTCEPNQLDDTAMHVIGMFAAVTVVLRPRHLPLPLPDLAVHLHQTGIRACGGDAGGGIARVMISFLSTIWARTMRSVGRLSRLFFEEELQIC